MWPHLLASSPLIERDKSAAPARPGKLVLPGASSVVTQGLGGCSILSPLLFFHAYTREPALNGGGSVGEPDYARIPTTMFLSAGQPEPKINNKPSAAAVVCRGRLRRNREEDPGEYEGPRQRRKMWKNRSNLGPLGRPQGADLPPRTPQGGCGRCHPTLRRSKSRKTTKMGFVQASPRGPPPPPSPKGLFIVAVSRGHLVAPFVRGVPETGARDYRESGAASKTLLEHVGHRGRRRRRNATLSSW